MFSTLLSSIQTAFSNLISKSFLISAMFPVCVFMAAMALMANTLKFGFIVKLFRNTDTKSGFQNTLTFSLIALGLLALAYIVDSLGTVMLETLEGRHLRGSMRAWFHAGQYRQLVALDDEIAEARDEAVWLLDDNTSRAADEALAARLKEVSLRRPKQQACNYPVVAAPGNPGYLILQLQRDRNEKHIIDHDDLRAAADAIEPYLDRYDEEEDSDEARALKQDRELFSRLALPWDRQLNLASAQGPKLGACVYPPATINDNPRTMIDELSQFRERGEPIPHAKVQAAVLALLTPLRNYSENDDTPAARELRKDRRRLLSLTNYARDRRKHDLLRLSNLKQFTYPGEVTPSEGKSSINVLAPTRFGNIGRTMRSYALTRYSLDLDLFWTRLQRTMQDSNDKFYEVIQETKAQVDCFVALTFLSATFAIWWLVYFIVRFEYPLAILATGIVGPTAVYTCYRLACQSYGVFADLIRTGVDAYRFGLLSDLHVAAPAGTLEEQRLWDLLGNRTGYDRKDTVPYLNK